jgi:hypothetical protein
MECARRRTGFNFRAGAGVQTTLLGFAIALILALLAALVGPHFVNWSDHRAVFEAEASRLVGLNVRVAGDIDAALLPSPSVTLRAISIGPAGAESRLRARSLRIELALGALMRGEIRAVEMRLVGPQFNVSLDVEGRIDWPAVALGTETLSIDRLDIEDGRATLTDARSGARLMLDELWFTGEVRSLTGPFRGKGDFASGGARYGYSIAAGRHGPDGIRVKLGLQTAEYPLMVEADGLLAFEGAAPRFDGTITLAQPAGAVLAGSETVAREPWRLVSKIKGSALNAQLEDVSFQYGPDERATMLSGSAEFRFGEQPQLTAALSARQIDLDRLFTAPDATRRLPFSAVRALGELISIAPRPAWPFNLAIGIDVATLGGAALQNIAADVRSDGAVWHLDRFELRAPGFTRLKLNGRLSSAGSGPSFTGHASVDTSDPKSLAAWLAGRARTAGSARPWRAKGVVMLGADRIAVDDLQTEFGRGAIEGRAAYSWPAGNRPAQLDTELHAAELDFDAMLAFGAAALSDLGLEWPGEVALALEIGHARIAGFEARDMTARLKFDAGGIVIDQLAIADFGDATIKASGRIQTTAAPGGHINVDLDARNLKGVVALVEPFAPILAEPLRRLGGRQNTAKLHAAISLENSGSAGAQGALNLAGQIGMIAIEVAARATGKREAFDVTNLRALADTDIRLTSQLKVSAGSALLGLIGLDRLAIQDEQPAQLGLSVTGGPRGNLQFAGNLQAGPIDVNGSGILRLPPDRPASLDLAQLAGAIGGNRVHGRLLLQFDETMRVDGSIDSEFLDVPATVAAAIGMPRGRGTDNEPAAWSLQPFASGASAVAGRIEFKAERVALSDALAARQLRGVARFNQSEVVFEDVAGGLANGRLEARLAFATDADGTTGRLKMTLNGAQADALIVGAERTPISGRLQLRAEIEGAGRSPAAFVGSLKGSGSVQLEGGRIAGLNPDVFGAVLRATELGIPTGGHRLREYVTGVLDNGALSVPRVEASIAIDAGLARLSNVVVRGGGTELEATAIISLADATLDALLTLTGPAVSGGGARPSVLIPLKGTLPAPSRTVDTTMLASWLTLRAVEQQAKELDAMERARGEAVPPQAMPAATTDAPEATGGIPLADRAPAQPPALDIPAAHIVPPNATVRPPGLIGAQD